LTGRAADRIANTGGRQRPAGDRLLFTVLYFAEGVPIGFLWWALPAVLREQGIAIDRITALTAAITVPWTLKFLAGPLMDRSVARGIGLRPWIIGCQLIMGLALLPLAAGEAVPDYRLLLILLISHACFAAVQDVAIDALCIRTVPTAQLGAVNGWMQFGMTTGRALTAALVPLLIATAGWRAAVFGVVALIWAPMILVLKRAREPTAMEISTAGAPGIARGILHGSMLLAACIALLAGSGFEAAGALAGPLLVDLGLDGSRRALFFGLVAPGGLALGGLLAARYADRLGFARALAIAVLLVALAVSALAAALGLAPEDRLARLAAPLLGLVYLLAGFLISASYACFMAVATGRWAATRFSLLMALTNACESASALAGGRIAAHSGYAVALPALAAVSLLSLPFIRRLTGHGARSNGSTSSED